MLAHELGHFKWRAVVSAWLAVRGQPGLLWLLGWTMQQEWF